MTYAFAHQFDGIFFLIRETEIIFWIIIFLHEFILHTQIGASIYFLIIQTTYLVHEENFRRE